MKRRKLLIIMGIAIVLILVIALYPQLGKSEIQNRIHAFLREDGFGESEIAYVEVRHSYISGMLGYGQWHTSIVFSDEPKVEYNCILSKGLIPNVVGICAGGFSTELPEDYQPKHYTDAQ